MSTIEERIMIDVDLLQSEETSETGRKMTILRRERRIKAYQGFKKED